MSNPIQPEELHDLYQAELIREYMEQVRTGMGEEVPLNHTFIVDTEADCNE